MTDLLRSLQDLFRLHPLPWRDNGIGMIDHAGCTVSSGRCAGLLADHGFDIVSLVEQCAEHGAPVDVKAEADEEIEEVEKSADAREAEMQQDIDDLGADVRRLEKEVRDLERQVEDLEDERDALLDRIEELLP